MTAEEFVDKLIINKFYVISKYGVIDFYLCGYNQINDAKYIMKLNPRTKAFHFSKLVISVLSDDDFEYISEPYDSFDKLYNDYIEYAL